MSEKPGNAADRAFLAVPIEQGHVAFGCGVEFHDFRDRKALLEFRPDIRPQAVAADETELVGALLRVRRRIDEVAAELADILQERALPAHHVVPEFAHREALADDDRAAIQQQCSGGEQTAGGVIERQAIVHAVARTRVHDGGEGMRREHQAVVVDIGGLRQAGGARRVDEERAILDGQRPPLAAREPLARESLDLPVDAGKPHARVAVQPDLRVRRQVRLRGLE